MFCEQCGTKIGEDKRFCTKCEEQKIIEIPKEEIVLINGKNIPTANNINKKSKRLIIIDIIFGFISYIPLFFGIYYLCLTPKTILGLILIGISIILSLQWFLGEVIGKRLSKKTGIVLGIILIVLGFTIFMAISIMIYSNSVKNVKNEEKR